MARLLLFLFCILVPNPILKADEPFFLRDGDRVLFLGDSNTYSGHFISYLDAYLFSRFPDRKFELLNLGLPSETVTGLSEPDHPFPRPNVQDRVVKALKETRPTVVVISYGMNDGIYYPFGEDRFQKYQQGIRKLIDLVQKQKARLVLLSPSPFDPLPLKKKILPATAKKFSWLTPYAGYDEVLGKYSQWLVSLRSPQIMVIDVHTAVNDHLRIMRKANANYTLAGDGIHPNPRGHWIVAAEILRAWNAPGCKEQLHLKLGAKLIQTGNAAAKTKRQENGIEIAWRIPLQVSPDPVVRKIWPVFQAKLVLEGSDSEQWKMKLDKGPIEVVSKEAMEQGIGLGNVFLQIQKGRSLALLEKAERRQTLLARAWLTHVGHNRPGTPRGMDLEEAQKEAQSLAQEIRQLCGPQVLQIQLFPVARK